MKYPHIPSMFPHICFGCFCQQRLAIFLQSHVISFLTHKRVMEPNSLFYIIISTVREWATRTKPSTLVCARKTMAKTPNLCIRDGFGFEVLGWRKWILVLQKTQTNASQRLAWLLISLVQILMAVLAFPAIGFPFTHLPTYPCGVMSWRTCPPLASCIPL